MGRNEEGQPSFIVFVLRHGSPDFVHEQGNLQFDLHLDSEAHESALHISSPSSCCCQLAVCAAGACCCATLATTAPRCSSCSSSY